MQARLNPKVFREAGRPIGASVDAIFNPLEKLPEPVAVSIGLPILFLWTGCGLATAPIWWPMAMAFNFGIANKNITHNGVEYVMSEKQANAYNKYIAIVKRYQKKIDKIVNDIWPQATEKNVRNSPKPFASWNENVMMRW